MSSRKKQPAAAADEGDIDTSFNPNKVAMAIHYYYTSREKVTWREAQKKFKVCSKTFNRYKSLWFTLRINQLPKIAQLKRLRECILEHHIIIRGGNYYLSHAEEQHILQWIITASERGKPFTGIQVRRMAAAIRCHGRKSSYDQLHPPSSCVDETSTSSTTPSINSTITPTSDISSSSDQVDTNALTTAVSPAVNATHEFSSRGLTDHHQHTNSVSQHITLTEHSSSISSQASDTTSSHFQPTASSSTASNSANLTQADIEKIALDYSIGSCDSVDDIDLIESINSIDPDATRKETPCYSWYKRFLQRYKKFITARRLKSRSTARYCAEDAERITKWFDEIYIPAIKKYNITHADQVLAMDETGVLDNAELHSGVKYVCSNDVTKHHEERGSNNRYSILHICSALGITLPPITIFQGCRMRVGMLAQAPQGTKYQFQESGYFLSDFLPDVIRHILKHHRPTMDGSMTTTDPRVWIDGEEREHIELTKTPTCHRIILMDNASVHRNIEAEKLAEANNIHIIYLPPNTTHFMQVSDVAVFASMKKKWYTRLAIDATTAARDDLAAAKYQVNVEGLTKQNFWMRFRPAWNVGTAPCRIVEGFRRTGQWPPNKNQPLKALPALKHGEDVQASAEHATALRILTLEDENRRLQRELAQANREIKKLKQSSVNQSTSTSTTASHMTSAIITETNVHESTSFERINQLTTQFTPPRKVQLKSHVSSRNAENEIHEKYCLQPGRLLDDDEANEAHEMQRLARLGEVVEHQTIVKGHASAMGKAEAEYIKALIREYRAAKEDLEAAKSATKAKTIERERAKRAEKAAKGATKKSGKRKRANDNDAGQSQSTPVISTTSSSADSSAGQHSKKRKVATVEPVPAGLEAAADDSTNLDADEYVSMCKTLRETLDHTPMTGAMRLRIKWMRQAQRSIDQFANWTITSCDEKVIKIRRSNDEPRTKRSVRRSLM
jgi:hypothetical protein